MLHNHGVSALIVVILILILYRLSNIKLQTYDTAMFYYVVLLEILVIGFEHLYEAFGDVCL